MKRIKWILLTRLHHFNLIENLKNNINGLEAEEIKEQLKRADSKKNKLIKQLNSEYIYYLKIIRELLFLSIEKGLEGIFSETIGEDFGKNSIDSSTFFEKKIKNLLKTQLPLLTLEQLKIRENTSNQNRNIKSYGLIKTTELKDHEDAKSYVEFHFSSDDSSQYNLNDNEFASSNYYQSFDNEELSSLDLDKREDSCYISAFESVERMDSEKRFFSSFLNLFENHKTHISKNDETIKNNIPFNSDLNQNLAVFNFVENSLSNLLLNLSYQVNLELLDSNIIQKMLPEDSYYYLLSNNFMIKHPHPFVINFDLDIIQTNKDFSKLSKIYLLNITPVELEFENLNLSIQRNKITNLKNQFQLLIKKERYWKQKEKNMNKMEKI